MRQMAKRIRRYIAYIDELLKRNDVDFAREAERHLTQVGFFMHERLIHLIVLVLFRIDGCNMYNICRDGQYIAADTCTCIHGAACSIYNALSSS